MNCDHTQEKYSPCSAEWFMARSSLVERGEDGQPCTILRARGDFTQEDLLSECYYCAKQPVIAVCDLEL